MIEQARPDLAPDPGASRAEMEALQHEIATVATFEDDPGVDLSSVVDVARWRDEAEPLERPDEDRSRPEADRTRPEADRTRPDECRSQDDESRSRDDDRTAPIVAGVDQAFDLEREQAISAIVAMSPAGGTWSVVERVHAVTPLEIPYIPGLLSFREGGSILAAVTNLSVTPDLLFFDGSGRIHFRQAGIATHVGVVLDVPTVGVAKSLLCGDPVETTTDLAPGERVAIVATDAVDAPNGTTIGYAVQTRQYDSPTRHINPLYVSPGHRVGAETAADLAAALALEYKLPEPIRLADAHAATVRDRLEA